MYQHNQKRYLYELNDDHLYNASTGRRYSNHSLSEKPNFLPLASETTLPVHRDIHPPSYYNKQPAYHQSPRYTPEPERLTDYTPEDINRKYEHRPKPVVRPSPPQAGRYFYNTPTTTYRPPRYQDQSSTMASPGCRIAIHAVGAFFLFLSFALVVAAVALPDWLTYNNTYLTNKYYLGLWEYCWTHTTTTNSITTTSDLKCEFNDKVSSTSSNSQQNPNLIHGSIGSVSIFLTVVSGLLALIAGACSCVGWCCKSNWGFCTALTWVISGFLGVLTSVTSVAYFILQTRKDTNMVYIDQNSFPAGQQYDIKIGYAYYIMCGTIATLIVSSVIGCVAVGSAFQARNDHRASKQQRVAPPN